MTAAPSQTPEAAGLEVVKWRWKAGQREPLVTAASAQARIAELEAERDQIAGESIWWKAVIGDGEYTPSGEVPSIKHLHPATVKPIYEAHKGTAVADVIAGLIFSRAITENREQFLVGYHTDRATAAEARADRLAKALDTLQDLFAREGECSMERFERLAEMFRKDTGYLAPGKDPGMLSQQPEGEELRRIYDDWFAAKIVSARAFLARNGKGEG